MPKDWYTPEVQAIMPLSSKSHWDLPINIHGRVLHLLASHPTPPVFDGDEDRNGRRNHDEIRFWVDFLDPEKGKALYDDTGRHGGLPERSPFVLCGDLNADPIDGDSSNHPIKKLLASPRINAETIPSSKGGAQASRRQGGANAQHRGDPAHDTGDFDDEMPGNLRVDYVLPSKELKVTAAKVYWPVDKDLSRASDHRLVYIDVAFQ